jgi:hypothetical protein
MFFIYKKLKQNIENHMERRVQKYGYHENRNKKIAEPLPMKPRQFPGRL